MCINGETKIIDRTDLAMVYQGNPVFLSQTLQCMVYLPTIWSILMVNDR